MATGNKRALEVERLTRLVRAFSASEPAILDASLRKLHDELELALPRLRAYAIETGEMREQVTFVLGIDFTPGSESILIETQITPPAYVKQSAVQLSVRHEP